MCSSVSLMAPLDWYRMVIETVGTDQQPSVDRLRRILINYGLADNQKADFLSLTMAPDNGSPQRLFAGPFTAQALLIPYPNQRCGRCDRSRLTRVLIVRHSMKQITSTGRLVAYRGADHTFIKRDRLRNCALHSNWQDVTFQRGSHRIHLPKAVRLPRIMRLTVSRASTSV